MGGYGGIQPGERVVFPFDTALPAARDLWRLAGVLREAQGERQRKADHANEDWSGKHHDTFVGHIADEATDVGRVADALQERARLLASQWAKAYGQQNRVRWAEWVDQQINDDGFLENVGEWFAGEDDYGDPPSDPEVPAPPAFEPTKANPDHMP